MPMNIEVCPNCGGQEVASGYYTCGCQCTTNPKELIVYTERELKQAQIEAYEDALRIYNHSYPLPMIRGRITALKQLMEE